MKIVNKNNLKPFNLINKQIKKQIFKQTRKRNNKIIKYLKT